jgi:hypothetical protein
MKLVYIFGHWRPLSAPRSCMQFSAIGFTPQAVHNIAVCFFKTSRIVKVNPLAKKSYIMQYT